VCPRIPAGYGEGGGVWPSGAVDRFRLRAFSSYLFWDVCNVGSGMFWNVLECSGMLVLSCCVRPFILFASWTVKYPCTPHLLDVKKFFFTCIFP